MRPGAKGVPEHSEAEQGEIDMKKVAIAVMLLATSAFGANIVSLSITDGVVVDGKVTVTMTANVPAGVVLNNFSIYSDFEDPGMEWLTFTGRTTAPSNVGILDFWQANPRGQNLGDTWIDFGVIPSGTRNYEGPGTFPLCDLTFDVAPDAEFPLIVTFKWGRYSGGGVFGKDMEPVTFTITPEPASMLLLAAGAAFFARRRRA